MSDDESIDVAHSTKPRGTSWLTWLVAILALLFAFGHFVVKPLIEGAVQGAGAVVAGLLVAAAQAVKVPYDMACHRVETNEAVKALVGEPIQCAPIEEAEWLEPGSSNTLAFKFEFTGPRGTGQAHAVVLPTDTGFQFERLDVTGPAGEATQLIEP